MKANQEIKLKKKSGKGRFVLHGSHLEINKKGVHGTKCSFFFNYLQDLVTGCPPETPWKSKYIQLLLLEMMLNKKKINKSFYTW
jgi:hypothetical protein